MPFLDSHGFQMVPIQSAAMTNNKTKTMWLMVEFGILVVFGVLIQLDFLNVPAVLGLLFVTGPSLQKFFWLSRSFLWISLNILKPKTKLNPYIWGNFLLFFGVITPFIEETEKDKQLKDLLFQSPEFWLTISIILLANIVIGIITANMGRRDALK